jgi:septal ring-binding cell division protein DamX
LIAKSASIFFLMSAVLLLVSAHADYKTGVNAYQNGDVQLALSEWQEVIESAPTDVHPQERAEALYAVAMLYWLGQGVVQDTTTSADYLRQAAELNHPGAQSKLGYLYLIGQGVSASAFEAFKWLEMAARQGDADAQYNLGVMYRDGTGVEANSDIALGWFEEAAANGDPVSAEVVAEFERKGFLQAQASVDEHEVPASSPETVVAAPVETLEEPTEPETMPPADLELQEANAESWILARNAANYTIQVIALKNLDSMTRLINAHQEFKPFAVYQQGNQDSILYVLVQGDYVDAESAQTAVQKFPSSLGKTNQFWIRRFSMVQDLIVKRQQQLMASGKEDGAP